MPLTFYKDFETKNYCFEPDDEFPDNKISNISRFNEWYDNFKACNSEWADNDPDSKKYDYFFRGTSEAKYKLYNSAQREWICNNMMEWKHDYTYLMFIKEMIRVAKKKPLFKKMLEYYQINYDNEADFPILSILQHYGAPTPLMDWSYNLDVALYFATENVKTVSASDDIDGYFSIHIINKKENENLKNIFEHSKGDFPNLSHFHDEKFNEHASIDFACYISDFEINNQPAPTIESNIPAKTMLQQNRPLTTYYNQNILPQEGLFIFNSSPIKSLEDIFSGHSSNKKLKLGNLNLSPFYCYNIRKDLADYIRRKISKQNINAAFIYPELRAFLNQVKEKVYNATLPPYENMIE